LGGKSIDHASHPLPLADDLADGLFHVFKVMQGGQAGCQGEAADAKQRRDAPVLLCNPFWCYGIPKTQSGQAEGLGERAANDQVVVVPDQF